jgi:serine/threonine protein kinase
VVAGRYRLVRPLGRGGMGAVWSADDELLGRAVAVKEIWFPATGDEPVSPADPLVRRALREAQAAARLRHPGIVTVYDVVIEAGRPWIIMELIDGQSLADAIREHGLLTERRTAEIGLQVLDALQAAHRAGIAHRDVKPANIMLAADRVVLTDFGIAAIDDATALTATGHMVGSPAYLAPERINGEPATAAGDLWALGVTLYTAVTGRSPFRREDTQSTFAAILNSRPATPAHAGRLWPVIKGLLAKDPARRLTAEQARTVLARAAVPAGGSAEATPVAHWSRRLWPTRPKRSRSTSEILPPTLNAPPPTIAAPTAYQAPGPAPLSPEPTVPQPAGSTDERAEAQTTAPLSATEAVTAAAHTVAAETVATRPAGDTETAGTEAALEVKFSAAETAAAETATYIAAANAAGADATARTLGPPAPYSAAGASTRRARRFTPGRLIASGLAVASLVAVAEAIWIIRPGPGTGHGNPTSSHSNPLAAAAPVATASRSAPASASANPALDSCLVGRWRMISMQIVIANLGGVAESTFSGPVGVTVRIWPDGKKVDDYNATTPLAATIKSAKYALWFRGVQTMHVQTRSGRIFVSEYSGAGKYRIARNGKTVRSGSANQDVPPDLPYICTETRLTVYGNKDFSTDTYTRVSRTP